MPKQSDPRVIIRAHLLRQQSLTLDQIMDDLDKTFEKDRVPDRSTIARHLRRSASSSVNELTEDEPLVWSIMTEVPWEDSRMVLDAWAHFQTSRFETSYGMFSRRLAKWVWRVAQALFPGNTETATLFSPSQPVTGTFDDVDEPQERPKVWTPTADDVLMIAVEYSWRELASVVLDEPFDTVDLDLLLALTPWKGRSYLERYHQYRDELGQFEWLEWHFRDIDWIDKINPGLAAKLRKYLGEGDKGGEERPYAERRYLREGDGLLYSQHIDYGNFVGSDPGDRYAVGEEPWHISYIAELLRNIKAQG